MRPPEISEYQSFYAKYISLVEGDVLTEILDHQLTDSLATLCRISETKSLHRYEPGKWSIKEMLGHLIDSERIFTYRALRFARNDHTPLSGFDQDPYVVAGIFDDRPWSELVAEFEHLRRSTMLFFRGLKPEAEGRFGVANNAPVTVRALGYIIAGHEMHHLGILREKYL
jgi:DinB family protein